MSIHVDRPIRSKPPSSKAKQQKGVRCRMFNLIAEIGFESRRGQALAHPETLGSHVALS